MNALDVFTLKAKETPKSKSSESRGVISSTINKSMNLIEIKPDFDVNAYLKHVAGKKAFLATNHETTDGIVEGTDVMNVKVVNNTTKKPFDINAYLKHVAGKKAFLATNHETTDGIVEGTEPMFTRVLTR